MTGELLEVVERLAKQSGGEIEVDLEIAVHEHVAEAGDSAETLTEARRQHVGFDEAVDGRAVGRRVEALSRGDMTRDVEGILRAEMQTALNGPVPVGIGAERRWRYAGVPA